MRWPRFIAHHSDDHPPPLPPPVDPRAAAEHQVVELDTEQLRALSNVFSAPKWLRDAGLASWLLAGVALLIVGLTWLAATTAAIVDPVIVGLIIATVASPAVRWLASHRVPRAAGAALLLLAIVGIVVVIVLLVIGGITSQLDEIKSQANAAAPKVQSWLRGLGLGQDGAKGATDGVGRATGQGTPALIHGLVNGISSLASAAIQLSFLALAIFFFLKDGPGMRDWVE